MNPDEGPTLETVAKLRPDVVFRLFEQGKLTRAMFSAAEEIQDTLQALDRWSMPFMRLGEEFMGLSPTHRVPLTPLERVSAEEKAAWRRRYLPWLKEAAAVRPFAGRVIPESRVVLDVVMGNRGVSQLERVYGIRRGKGLVTGALKVSLHRYAELAGWVQTRWLAKSSCPRKACEGFGRAV